MSSLDFPLNPIDGQEYSLNGVTYYYNAALGAWLTKLSSAPLPTAFNRQVLFNDAGLSNGSYGLVFDKSANTLFANTINVSSNMRVFGNLQIGTGTVTITNNSISAASIIVDGSAIPSGAAANLAFDTANAAYGLSNTTNTFAYGVAVNAAAAFAAANNVGPQIAPAYNTANASYGKANTALQNTSGTFAGNLSVTGNADFSLGTSYLKLPVGTTAQRPAGANGMIRFNTTTGQPEWYDNVLGGWSGFNVGASYAVDYLVVAGGGGGGGGNGGGGGGSGGYLASSLTATSGSQYIVTVGSGGSGTSSGSSTGSSGSASSLTLLSTTIANAIGGGGGGGSGNSLNLAGLVGGSGGGGTGATSPSGTAGGNGTVGQGNAGQPGFHYGGAHISGGGGGGAAAMGTAGSTTSTGQGGDGGNGSNWQSLGTYYAGGGGGGLHASGSRAGNGGQGGGGAGSYLSTNNGTSGTTNRGGGGGGAGNSTTSGNGGSGVVIIRYAGSQRGSGGTVTSAGGYTYHTFNSSGTFTA